MEAYSWCAGNDFKKISLHMHRYPAYCFAKRVKIESPYTAAARTHLCSTRKNRNWCKRKGSYRKIKAAFFVCTTFDSFLNDFSLALLYYNTFPNGIKFHNNLCGTKVPSLPVFINICNALKISPDYLLRDFLTDNDVSKIRELTELWENTPPSQHEIAAAMLRAVLERKKE